jgi:hypothetical protein
VIDLRVAASCLLLAILAGGCASAPPAMQSTGRSPQPSMSATDAATETPEPTIPDLGEGEQALEAGTYRMAAGSGTFPRIVVTVPDGWNNLDGWVLNRGGASGVTVAMQLWDVHQVYGHPCQWDGTLFQPGPRVDDLAEALIEVPMRNATQPTEVSLDGFVGKYLEWSVPADIEMDEQGDFPDCDLTDDGHRDFKSWTGTGNGWGTNRYHQGPGQVDRLWILDVDGKRLVIDAFDMPLATHEEREELVGVVESIEFER